MNNPEQDDFLENQAYCDHCGERKFKSSNKSKYCESCDTPLKIDEELGDYDREDLWESFLEQE